MSTKTQAVRKAGVILLPVLTAAPMVCALVYLVYRYGPTILKLLNILIKMAVTS